jgi:hypothetical protein
MSREPHKPSAADAKRREGAAEALESTDAEALEGVRRTTGEGEIHPHRRAHKAGEGSDPHIEENLDRGLEETFPASDPVSISTDAG